MAVALPASAQIRNIRAFLDQCPQNDPAFAQIRAEFEIRREGVVMPVPPCTEPVSAMPASAYTDELIVLQSLRVIYYMDRGMSGHLPWTTGTLYDWMRSKIGGIDIVQGYSFCCELFNWTPPPVTPPTPGPGPPPIPPPPDPPPAKAYFIGVGFHTDYDREFDKTWPGIAANIALYGHEVRHRDGFPHTSCCGIGGGCDQTFDPASLSPYAVQWWLSKLWLDGTIDVGMQCLPPVSIQSATNWFFADVTSVFPTRFCDAKPAAVSLPKLPGGPCLDLRRRAVRH